MRDTLTRIIQSEIWFDSYWVGIHGRRAGRRISWYRLGFEAELLGICESGGELYSGVAGPWLGQNSSAWILSLGQVDSASRFGTPNDETVEEYLFP